VLFEEAVDCGLQVDDGPKDAALEPALCEGCEEALDRVEPRGRCRGEMERPSRMALEPSANIGMLMGGVIVDDGVDRLSYGNLFLDDIEETDELLMAMRCMLRPITLPSRTFIAANKVVVPCRS
jgi:hypothetical protein